MKKHRCHTSIRSTLGKVGEKRMRGLIMSAFACVVTPKGIVFQVFSAVCMSVRLFDTLQQKL